MGYFVIGTAGHIDHGKTSLVKALTGIDTDRLKEEKVRGITIETGYAYFKIPEKNITVGIVDVPGHEKFIKNMVSGIYGIDVLMLIIAADESIMPQTIEHMEICKLLGIKKGFIVITKIDLVDEEILEIIKDDIKNFVKNTFLENSPVFYVSSLTGKGIEELKNYIIQLASKISSEKPISSIFRLPVDRVFSLKGFGTVVTGTTLSGKIKIGDNVIIYPENLKSRVRNIQVHNTPVNEAIAGQRTAINLQGIEKEDIHRGSILAEPGYFQLNNVIYTELYYLESNKKPLKNRRNVKFHIGTEAIPAEINIINKKEIIPGEKVFSIFKLKKPTIALNGDKFIVRSFDDKNTLGGGKVLYSSDKKLKINDLLSDLCSEKPENIIETLIKINKMEITSLKKILSEYNSQREKIERALKNLISNKSIIEIEDNLFIHSNNFKVLKENFLKNLKEFHQKNPELSGIPKEELRTKIYSHIIDSKLFNYLVNTLINENKIELEGDNIKLKNFSVKLSSEQKNILEKILSLIENGGVKPPVVKEISNILNISEKELSIFLNILSKNNKIIKISPEIYFSSKVYTKIKENLIKFLKDKGQISIKEFKEMTKTSRKYIIPLLEHFDSVKLTIRKGDCRVLRE